MKKGVMTDNSLIQHSKKWDRTGIFVATLCLIHCLALPLLLALIPTTQFLHSTLWIEFTVLSLGVLIGSISFFTSYKKHKMLQPMFVGFIGICFLLFSLIDSHTHGLRSGLHWSTIIGGSFLIAGHLWNIRACSCYCDKTCDHDHHDHSH